MDLYKSEESCGKVMVSTNETSIKVIEVIASEPASASHFHPHFLTPANKTHKTNTADKVTVTAKQPN